MLRRCVDSVRIQGFDDIEILLINDGSTDGSGIIAEEYAATYKNIKYWKKENGGLSDARNFGIERAEGDYITFVDSDDELAPNTYSPLIALLQEHPFLDILEYPMLQRPGLRDETLFNPGNHLFKDALDWLAYKERNTAGHATKYTREAFSITWHSRKARSLKTSYSCAADKAEADNSHHRQRQIPIPLQRQRHSGYRQEQRTVVAARRPAASRQPTEHQHQGAPLAPCVYGYADSTALFIPEDRKNKTGTTARVPLRLCHMERHTEGDVREHHRTGTHLPPVRQDEKVRKQT